MIFTVFLAIERAVLIIIVTGKDATASVVLSNLGIGVLYLFVVSSISVYAVSMSG